ncbi:MAG: hypothetical protein QXK08_03600 [Candidatus Woesearchaeota archaeon]
MEDLPALEAAGLLEAEWLEDVEEGLELQQAELLEGLAGLRAVLGQEWQQAESLEELAEWQAGLRAALGQEWQ